MGGGPRPLLRADLRSVVSRPVSSGAGRRLVHETVYDISSPGAGEGSRRPSDGMGPRITPRIDVASRDDHLARRVPGSARFRWLAMLKNEAKMGIKSKRLNARWDDTPRSRPRDSRRLESLSAPTEVTESAGPSR